MLRQIERVKVGFFGSIEVDVSFYGRRKLDLEEIVKMYGTRRIGSDQARGLLGDTFLCGCRSFQPSMDVEVVEAEAIKWALNYCVQQEVNLVLVEYDCLAVNLNLLVCCCRICSFSRSHTSCVLGCTLKDTRTRLHISWHKFVPKMLLFFVFLLVLNLIFRMY